MVAHTWESPQIEKIRPKNRKTESNQKCTKETEWNSLHHPSAHSFIPKHTCMILMGSEIVAM
jgi:hypothetical protein